jgi:hypothetical protein
MFQRIEGINKNMEVNAQQGLRFIEKEAITAD